MPSLPSESALMVKSRRLASAEKSRPNATFAWRPSVSTSSRRAVVSIGRPSTMRVTVPCAKPGSAILKPARRARRTTSSGVAVVARSKSPTWAPSARSRTAPPTRRVSSPSPLSASSARASGPRLSAVKSFSLRPSNPTRTLIRSVPAPGRRSLRALARKPRGRAAQKDRARRDRVKRRPIRPASLSTRGLASNVRTRADSARATRDRRCKRRKGSEKERAARGQPVTSGKQPLVQVAQYSGGCAPDITPLMPHDIEFPTSPLPSPFFDKVIGRVHQERERRLEDLVDLELVDRWRERRGDERNERGDAKSGAGKVGIEPADRLDGPLFQSHLLLRLS